MDSQVQEIKSKIDVVDLISEYIQLKQAGGNWRACCPFHNEKSPSFMVSREKQIWHCFGCGEGGDVFTFIQKMDNIDFPESLKILAQKAGVKLKRLNPELVSQKTKLMDLTKLAADFFHKAFLESKEGQIARDYLKKRTLTAKTISDFYLGYAPESWDRLLNLLIKKGFKSNEIFLAGLVVKNDRGKLYDRFRQRLMFPIFDHNQNIVGFTGRVLDETKENQGGKYVNTPQTLLYNKSLVIYGLDKAKQEIKKKGFVVLVEGNMDVIASYQSGVKNVIASSGTALTLEQLKILNRYTNDLRIAFDADYAGQIAAERGIETALSLGINLKVITLPEKINGQPIKDPDDCIKQGKEHWEKAIDKAVSIMEFYFKNTFKQFDVNNPQDKKEIAARLLKQISKLIDKVEQAHWLKKLAQKLDVPENILFETFSAVTEKKAVDVQPVSVVKNEPVQREELLAEQLLALVFKFPENIEYLIDHLEPQMVTAEELKLIYTQLILYYNKVKHFENTEFENTLKKQDPELVSRFSTLLLLADKDFFDLSSSKSEQEILKLIKQIKKNYINLKIKQIQRLITEAEESNDQKQIEDLSKEFSVLIEQLHNI